MTKFAILSTAKHSKYNMKYTGLGVELKRHTESITNVQFSITFPQYVIKAILLMTVLMFVNLTCEWKLMVLMLVERTKTYICIGTKYSIIGPYYRKSLCGS